MSKLVGIDLGTTNCCIAVLQGGAPTVVPTRQGHRTMPSLVAFSSARTELVGVTAQRQAATNPERTVFGVKRLIGRKASDEKLQPWKQRVPYKIVAAPNGDAWVRTPEGDYSSQEISAILLQELKACAEDFLGEEVREAVVTVPAYFNDSQRQATKDAGRIAGLDVRNILNEPTAAALGYGYQRKNDCRLAIFDLGGGTFDVTILQVRGGVFEVLATNGDTFLGGSDFDRCLVEFFADQFREQHGVSLLEDPVALQRLTEAAQTAKHELSTTETTAVNLPFISSKDGPLHFGIDSLGRNVLERITRHLVEALEAPCRAALSDAGVAPAELDSVLLVGGMTRMPAVRNKVEEIFGPIVAKDVNPDEIVAVGAATQSAIMSGELDDVVLLDVTPHSLGVRVRDGRMSPLIRRNTTIPTSATKPFTTTQGGQDFVEIKVYQGEQELVDANTYLGQFTLTNLPERPAGEVKVDVTFLIDADGVLSVTATEDESGRAAHIKIEPSGGLSKDQVKRLTRERRPGSSAERHGA